MVIPPLGRNFVITATHVAGSSGDSNDSLVNSQTPEMRRWGQTTYSISPNSKSQNYGYDITFTRFNKYIVEGETEIFDAGLQSDANYTSSNINKEKEQQNLQNLKKYLKDHATDSNDNLIVFQAGSGTLSLFSAPGGKGFNNAGIAAITGTRGGSFSNAINLTNTTYENSKANIAIKARGIQMVEFSNSTWRNGISPGDSGSGFYIYDKTKKKWLLLGVTSKADLVGKLSSGIAVATKKDFEEFKKSKELEIDLSSNNSGKVELSNTSLNGTTLAAPSGSDKDIVLKGGGNIEVIANVYRNNSGQVGGFVFKAKNGANAGNPTTYTLTSKNGTSGNGNKPFGIDSSGLDIEENVTVKWGLGFIKGNGSGNSDKRGVNDALHKVGKGTLEITTKYDTPPSDGKYGYLRVGDGKVVFNTEKQAFNGVYLTSGRGTLELTKDKAQAFGARKNTSPIDAKLPNHFILDQNKVTELGFYFGNGGGNLDLKGNSLTLNTISSNDSRANIINTDADTSNPSYITIEGYGYNNEQSNKNKTQSKADTIIHASFGQSTNGTSTNTANTNNNLNLIYKGEPNGTGGSQANGSQAALIFDGNIDAKGLEVTNGKVVLQGHPTTHAYIRDQQITVGARKENFLNIVKRAENADNLPEWMDFSRPSHLEQPDWDHRVFKFEKIDLTSGARLDIGREATLQGNITADDKSTINFGGDIEHYIDKKDGENTTGNGFEYQQEVEKRKLTNKDIANQTIHFKGEITANGTTINSHIYDFNAKLDLKSGAKLNADFLTLDRETHANGAILTMDTNSTANVKNLVFKGIKDSNHSSIISGANSGSDKGLKVTESLGFEKSTFDLSKLSEISGMNQPQNYDIFAKEKSNITGTSKTITGNVGVMSGSTLNLQAVTLSSPSGSTGTATNPKNTIIVQGKDSKLSVNQKITSSNQDNTMIFINGSDSTQAATTQAAQASQGTAQATLTTTQGIELSGTTAQGLQKTCNDNKVGVGCFNDDSMKGKISGIVLENGKLDSNLKATNLALNIAVDKDSSFLSGGKTLTAEHSSVGIALGKQQEFNIDAKSQSHIVLNALESTQARNATTATQEALYQGTITADSSQIDSNLSNITAKVDLQNGAKLNIAEGGTLTLDTTHNSISLSGSGTELNAKTIIAKNLNALTLNVTDSAKLNTKNFIFQGGSLTSSGFYGENVRLQDSAQVTFSNSGTIAQNLFISGSSTFDTQPNEAMLSAGKTLAVYGSSTFKVANGQGTLGVVGSGDDKATEIQVEKGSKLEISKLLAQGGSKVIIALDLDKVDMGENTQTRQMQTQEAQKNFSIEAARGSSVYLAHWDMNREGFDSKNKTTSLITDTDSRIHFDTLTHDMAKANNTRTPIAANLSISQGLQLENVGAAKNTSTPSSTPSTQAAAQSAQDDRFHALYLQNTQDNARDLTLENGTRIDVKLASSITAEAGEKASGFQLNKYYTLISAGTITDKRTDKRINFTFTSTPLYWVTLVENGEIKVKFTTQDPSSYDELKNYISDDKLLEILIQHNPKDDFVQMAGTANQHKELDGYLARIDKDLGEIARHSELGLSDQILLANDQSINARIAQVQYAQSRFSTTPTRFASSARLAGLKGANAFIPHNSAKNGAWLSVAGGGFAKGGESKAAMGFYGTNVGYDRTFSFGDDSLIIGAMAGFGGSNYYAQTLNDIAKVVNLGLYGLYQKGGNEIQSNLSFSMIMGERALSGLLGSESLKADSLGLLSHTYYKYRFVLAKSSKLESVLKPVGLLSVGYNGIGAYTGANYKQQAYNAFNLGFGAGAEYTLASAKSSYTLSFLAKQNIYSSADQVFVSLSNASSFIGYEINPINLTFQLGFVGSAQLGRGFTLQYGLAGTADIKGSYGGKADIKLEYKF